MISLQLVTRSDAEVVPLATFREHLGTNVSDDTKTLSIYLGAAVKVFENLSGVQLRPATYKLSLDCWPPRYIYLPRWPLVSVESIKYYDADDTQQTSDDDLYHVDLASRPGRIQLTEWPAHNPDRPGAIEIEYSSGFAVPAQIDDDIKTAILLQAASWYAVRENEIVGTIQSPVSMGFKNIATQYKVVVPYPYIEA